MIGNGVQQAPGDAGGAARRRRRRKTIRVVSHARRGLAGAAVLSTREPVAVADDALIERNPDLFAADMDGELVMMSISRGEYFGLGGIAPRLWALLETPVTPAFLRERVLAEFAVDEPTCRRDIAAFIDSMMAKGLVRAR
jgi:hypothetical protein